MIFYNYCIYWNFEYYWNSRKILKVLDSFKERVWDERYKENKILSLLAYWVLQTDQFIKKFF